jgi:cytochrome c-type biogenesis protein CcmH/NrfG
MTHGRLRALSTAFVLAAAPLFTAMLLAACVAGPLGTALSMVPWTPLLSASLASRGDDPDTRKLLNELQVKGDWPGVIRLAQSRLAVRPNDADWMLVLGYAQMSSGAYPAAIDTLTTVTRIDPEDIDAWNLLAEGQRLTHQNERAQRTLEHAMSVDSSSPVSPYLLGEINRDSGRLDEAVRFYRRSVQLEPEYTVAWYAMGLCFMQQHRPQELDEVVGALKKLDPGLAADLEQRAKAAK